MIDSHAQNSCASQAQWRGWSVTATGTKSRKMHDPACVAAKNRVLRINDGQGAGDLGERVHSVAVRGTLYAGQGFGRVPATAGKRLVHERIPAAQHSNGIRVSRVQRARQLVDEHDLLAGRVGESGHV